ncbi:MAG: ATPase domain-containing protein, partial [Ferruginibacter sp.]
MKKNLPDSFPKTPTGIEGLDEITGGGLPKGRPTLICGTAGCGKTLFGIQFLAKGISDFNEPGVLMSFEESKTELTQNVKSLGINLEKLVRD